MMKKFTPKGTITALATPFKSNGELDFNAFKKLIDFQIDNGVDAIAVCSTTGEGSLLTIKEKVALITQSVEHANGRVPIIVATGTHDTHETWDLTVLAKEHGAAAALIVTPYYVKPSQNYLFSHYGVIAEKVDIPIILYNVPGRTGVNMLPDTQIALAQAFPNIIATKEASGDLEQILALIRYAPDGFSVLSGDDAYTLPLLSVGAKGVISVISNYAPKRFSEMVNLALAGKFAKATEIHNELFELMSLNFIEPNPVPVKAAMSMLGLMKFMVRMPLNEMDPENKKLIKDALKKANIKLIK